MTNNFCDVFDRPALLSGNEAIAKAALDAGVQFVSCYPGTPSSEVVETLLEAEKNAKADWPVIEYSINEKVALETACGASLAGHLCMVTMKHVGVNVAADPLFTSAYIGMPGGLVLLSADDPGCHSSQNEQDNRHYARAANLPCFEPASSQEAYDMAREAFRLARALEQPVMLRTVTRVNHARSPVTTARIEPASQKAHKPIGLERVPVPMVAKKRQAVMLEHMLTAAEEAEKSKFNITRFPASTPDKADYGIIASGIARAYLKDALAQIDNEKIAILELGMTWPLPKSKIRKFLSQCSQLLVLEEGERLLEKEIKELAHNLPVKIEGKSLPLANTGELSTTQVLHKIKQWLGQPTEKSGTDSDACTPLPGRAPNLCPGCAHRSVYYAARKAFGDEVVYSSDIGCYTLGLMPPLKTADFAICMGSSISAGAGYAKASGLPVVAFIGDSTFFHSGMTGLANSVFNKRDVLLVILDNGTTAMTGHQPHPGMAQEALGDKSEHLDIEAICKGIGAPVVRTVKSHNLAAMISAFKELGAMKGVRVLIAREPCLLFGRSTLGKARRRVAEVISQGEAAEKCLHELACPAFEKNGHDLRINENTCGGCMLCVQIAPEAFRPKKMDKFKAL